MISSTYSGWIDLFGWGTSGWNSGANCYQPYSTSTKSSDYIVGDSCINCLAGNYANADWGVYNTISNGGDNNWRTLTDREWCYVLFGRNTKSGIRYALATVNGIKGLVLLPDNWDKTYYTLHGTNSQKDNYDCNNIELSIWIKMLEANGAVFLPACGYRVGNKVEHRNYGYYWSSSSSWRGTNSCEHHALGLNFGVYNMTNVDITYHADNYSWRTDGYSVRLVTTGNQSMITEYNMGNREISIECNEMEEIYINPEKQPMFPNGSGYTTENVIYDYEYVTYDYMQNNIKYPQEALENDICGEVMVEFVVEIDGSVSNVHVLKGLGYGCDEEAIRLIENMPAWIPGEQNGKPIRSLITISIDFYKPN